MNFSEQNTLSILPQFSEISSQRINVTASNYVSSANNQHKTHQNTIFTTAANSNTSKQNLVNSQNKNLNTNTNLIWNDPNTAALMQLCEKQGLQTLNIPAYNQNNGVLGVQSHNLPMRIIPNVYAAQMDQSVEKNDVTHLKNGNGSINFNNTNSQTLQQPNLAKYLQEQIQQFQNTSYPLAFQHFLSMTEQQIKKEKGSDQKNEQTQNSILNIPNVPIYKNPHLQNDNQFLHNEHTIMNLNPSDVNVHMEDRPESHGSSHSQSQSLKHDQNQAESSKSEKKMKFRAKTGEIKTTLGVDGCTLYCCPECGLAFSQKSEIDEHLQVHISERKYQCKECGAMLKRKEHLDQHMRGHSNERPFKCSVCLKAFKRNEHLTRHYVIHSGDKNFSCHVCQKAFSRKDHLNKHSQTHLGIKKPKPKKDSIETSGTGSNHSEVVTPLRLMPEINNFLKDGNLKQDSSVATHQFLQQLQNFSKDNVNFIQTFSAFKDQMVKDSSVPPHQAVNMSEILPQTNSRYMMPS